MQPTQRLLLCAAALSVLSVPPSRAAEGMWRPSEVPTRAEEMSGLGIDLDPAALSSPTDFPLGAVATLGGCTASFVSPEGLVITNRHCVRGSLQYASTPERDLLEHGFVAARRADELPAAPGTRLSITVEISDVTSRVLAGLAPETGGLARYRAIEANQKAVIAECEREPGYRCSVHAEYEGLLYALHKRLELTDVRLVYAPSRAIGAFGGQDDNWTWPRHTADFAFYRAYVGKDGKPAPHAAGNVPFRPSRWLRIGAQGVAAGDPVLVLGYPGRTRRLALAREVEHAFEWNYPTRRELLADLRRVVEAETAGRPEAALRYASALGRWNNAIKNYEGMLEGNARAGIVARRRKYEADIHTWLDSDQAPDGPALTDALAEIDDALLRQQQHRERDLVLDTLENVALLEAARDLYRWSREREKPDAEREPGFQERDLARVQDRLRVLERRWDPAVDRALWTRLLERYLELPAGERVPALDQALGLGEGTTAVGAKLDRFYATTELGDTGKRLAWLERPAAELESSRDPFLQLAVALYEFERAREEETEAIEGDLKRLRPFFMQARSGYAKRHGTSPFNSDANGALRLTYGRVEGYFPRDGVSYAPFTRAEGILEKATAKEPFDAPAGLVRAIREHAWAGRDAAALGSVPVNFLTTVDGTGGNSGSPTLDGQGNLVGLLFDGTWESIASDWAYDSNRTRSIHVDIRYVLWILERIEPAEALLREMGVDPPSTRAGVTTPTAVE